jgi:selenide,water dikinase
MKAGQAPDDVVDTAVASMTRLNREAAAEALAAGATGATDVTGFGLLGHASHIARASGVTLRIDADAVPLLPGARTAAERGVRTGGGDRNLEYLGPHVAWGSRDDVSKALLVDPQTSGGLLVALPASRVPDYLSAVPGAVEIGAVVAKQDHWLVVA